MLRGFSKRPYHWQNTVAVQHELAPGVAMTAGYYRTWFGNFTVTDNLAVTPADFNPFCVTAPVDNRLGSASGTQLCGLYDVSPARFGRVDNLVVLHSRFGERTELYNGFDVAVNARFGTGGILQGGVAGGKTLTDTCTIVDSPQAARPGFCRTTLPLAGQMQYKVSAIYPLPYGVQLSGVVQNLPGIPTVATWVVPNAQVVPTLGRNLSSGATGTVSVDLLEPNTQFSSRLSQVDLRLTKILRVGKGRLKVDLDIYNLFNARDVLSQVTAYGPQWLRPTTVLGGRLIKFGGQFDY
ncbi:MAG: hypothetical protein FJW23_05605 [Acidimicrobiia bacterium]|nr:hypothetical protein [Acidimicrobiia bacterium]